MKISRYSFNAATQVRSARSPFSHILVPIGQYDVTFDGMFCSEKNENGPKYEECTIHTSSHGDVRTFRLELDFLSLFSLGNEIK